MPNVMWLFAVAAVVYSQLNLPEGAQNLLAVLVRETNRISTYWSTQAMLQSSRSSTGQHAMTNTLRLNGTLG